MICNKLHLAAGALLLLAMSCNNVIEPECVFQEGVEKTVAISFNAVPERTNTLGTKAIANPDNVDEGTGSGYEVKDFWLIQYGSGGGLVGSPKYYTSQDLEEAEDDQGNPQVSILMPTSGTYTVYILANTHSENLRSSLTQCVEEGMLRIFAKSITAETSLYHAGNESENGDLYMNGILKIEPTTTELKFNLYRNVAKLTLELTNSASSGITINTVQVRNVPDKLFYADRLWHMEPDGDGGQQYVSTPNSQEVGYMDFNVDVWDPEGGSTQEFIWYLPRNCQGTNASDASHSKNNNAPTEATYIEVMATDNDTKMPIRYRFYPGLNMENDFNIIPNYHYELPVRFNHKGNDGYDSRIEDMGNVNLGAANSYIINPLSTEQQSIYSVETSRINLFWSSPDGKAQDGTYPNMIGSGTEWVAEIIWQDGNAQLIEFWDESQAVKSQPIYNGKGENPFRFRVKKGAKGNVLIGVRKKIEPEPEVKEYLWSWHLWITDYSPNDRVALNPQQYKYSVANGHVYRYAGGAWETEEYRNTCIMDRPLGAMEIMTETTTDLTNCAGMYYQFGRKDPFRPDDYDTYKADGSSYQYSKVAGPTKISTAVTYPYNYYTLTGSDSEWISKNEYYQRKWNNPTWYTENKSLFDPCPLGWKLPNENTWANFWYGISGGAQNVPNAVGGESKDNFKKGWAYYISAKGSGDTDMYVAPGLIGIDGGDTQLGVTGFYWTEDSAKSTSGSPFYFNNEKTMINPHRRAYAMNVRCIKE